MELRFSYLARVESAKLNGDRVDGKWAPATLQKTVPAPNVEEFVNLRPTDAEILKFTKMYGPLERDGQNSFSFALADWKKVQRRLQESWLLHSESTLKLHRGVELRQPLLTAASLQVTLAGGKAFANVPSLWELFEYQLDEMDPRHIRVCANPECSTGMRYFISTKLKYCPGGVCQHWGKRQTKLKWWNANRRTTR